MATTRMMPRSADRHSRKGQQSQQQVMQHGMIPISGRGWDQTEQHQIRRSSSRDASTITEISRVCWSPAVIPRTLPNRMWVRSILLRFWTQHQTQGKAREHQTDHGVFSPVIGFTNRWRPRTRRRTQRPRRKTATPGHSHHHASRTVGDGILNMAQPSACSRGSPQTPPTRHSPVPDHEGGVRVPTAHPSDQYGHVDDRPVLAKA